MARTLAAVLALSTLSLAGCKSREQKACERMADMFMERIGELGEDPGDRAEQVTSCLEMRQDSEANDEEWDTYIGCLEKAEEWGDMEVCLMELGFAAGKRKAGL